jgi:hypothetical protein
LAGLVLVEEEGQLFALSCGCRTLFYELDWIELDWIGLDWIELN